MKEKKSKSNNSKKDKITPGPGEYKINNEIGLGPKYTIRKKLKKIKKMIFLVPVIIMYIQLFLMVLLIQWELEKKKKKLI